MTWHDPSFPLETGRIVEDWLRKMASLELQSTRTNSVTGDE